MVYNDNVTQFNPMQFNLENSENIKCEQCQCEVFEPALIIKKISAFTSPSGKEELLPIQVLKCSNCNSVMTDKNQTNTTTIIP